MRLPDDLYELEKRLEVDTTIDRLLSAQGRQITLHARWENGAAAKLFARRSIEVALIAAQGADVDEHVGEVLRDWHRVSKQARRASIELGAFLKAIAPDGKFPNADSVARVRAIDSYFIRKLGPNTARREADEIVRALSSAESFVTHFEAYALKIIASNQPERQNIGRPGKGAFVYALSESWMHLTGRFPGKQSNANPFLDYVEAAWSDIGEATESFAWYLRDLRTKLSNIDPMSFSPAWK